MESLNKIKSFYENLSIEDIDKLGNIYEEEAFFKDPFNELNSLTLIKKLFSEMFEELDNPHFKFIDEIMNDNQIFLSWDFIFYKNSREYIIHGSSHLKVSSNNKISYHRDYWDVGEELLLKVPIVKSIYNLFRNKLSVKK